MIRRNIAANFAGRGWSALMAIIFVPLYVRFLGIESYGLLGFILSIQGLLALLDLGLSYAATRELARHHDDSTAPDILRTYEVVYWIAAVFLGGLVVVCAPWIAVWANYSTLTEVEAISAVQIFGIALGVLWPSTLYNGCLAGLERQVTLNLLNAVISTARSGGAVLVLWLWSASLEAMLGWQVLINLAASIWLRNQVWRVIGNSRHANFKFGILKSTARYAVGVSGILVLLTLLSQMDKLFLTRYLNLSEFGYYVVATTVAAVFSYLATPVTAALFPRLVQSIENGNHIATASLYHRGAQLIALAVIPVVAVLVFFAPDILYVWTRDHVLVQKVTPILVFLAAASGVNALVQLSYTLQAAAGLNRVVFYVHLASVLAMAPAFFYVIPKYGAMGAAAAWLVIYSIHLIVGPMFMHRRLLQGHYGRWLSQDVGLPALTCVGVVGLARYMSIGVTGTGETLAVLFLAWMLGTASQFAVSRELHSVLTRLWTPHHA